MNDQDISLKERVARFRLQVIGPLLASPPEPGALQAVIRELSERVYQHPLQRGTSIRLGFPPLSVGTIRPEMLPILSRRCVASCVRMQASGLPCLMQLCLHFPFSTNSTPAGRCSFTTTTLLLKQQPDLSLVLCPVTRPYAV